MEIRGLRGTPSGKENQTQAPDHPHPPPGSEGETEAHQRESWQPISLGNKGLKLTCPKGLGREYRWVKQVSWEWDNWRERTPRGGCGAMLAVCVLLHFLDNFSRESRIFVLKLPVLNVCK